MKRILAVAAIALATAVGLVVGHLDQVLSHRHCSCWED